MKVGKQNERRNSGQHLQVLTHREKKLSKTPHILQVEFCLSVACSTLSSIFAQSRCGKLLEGSKTPRFLDCLGTKRLVDGFQSLNL